MYLEEIKNKLPGQRILIKYDCDGKFENCGKESTPIFKVAEKNFQTNGGKHICRSCQLKIKNPMKDKKVQEKIKKTCLEKYGTTTALNTQKEIEKRKQQFENKEFVEQLVEKRKKTNLEKYGVEFAQQSEQVKEKQKGTMLDRYGVEHPYQSDEIMAKMKASNLEKYGVENVAQLPEVQIKMAKTTLERYGVEHYNQLPEMKDYLRDNCREWLKESYENGGPNKGIIRPEEWNQKQRETIAKLIDEGKWIQGSNNSIKGIYDSKKCLREQPMFRSSYELKYHYFLDHNDDVELYDYEPFQIPYYDTEGKLRHYTIDFIVKYKNKNISCVEIKNNYNNEEYLIGGKYEAAIKLCSEQNMKLEVLTNDGIKALNLDLKMLLELKEVSLFGK